MSHNAIPPGNSPTGQVEHSDSREALSQSIHIPAEMLNLPEEPPEELSWLFELMRERLMSEVLPMYDQLSRSLTSAMADANVDGQDKQEQSAHKLLIETESARRTVLQMLESDEHIWNGIRQCHVSDDIRLVWDASRGSLGFEPSDGASERSAEFRHARVAFGDRSIMRKQATRLVDELIAANKPKGGRNPKWHQALDFVGEYQREHPDATDGVALDAYRRKYRKRECPSAEQLQKSRSNRRKSARKDD